MMNVLLYTCILITPGYRQTEKEELMQTAWESYNCSVQIHIRCVYFPLRTALKYAYIYISIMESILRNAAILVQVLEDVWHIKTSHLFCCSLNSELVGVFEEILMRKGVNRACMQSLFLQLVDATDHLSRNYWNISAVTCMHLTAKKPKKNPQKNRGSG